MKESNTNKYIISVETTYIPDYEMQLPYKYFFTYELPKTTGLSEILLNTESITIKKETEPVI